jgi:hypothetical protein
VAVSPLRALLTAQAQSTWNRLRREGGEASVVAAGLVTLVAALAMAPPTWGCFVSGRSFGRGLADGVSLSSGVAGFQALILCLAVLSGLVEHRLLYAADGFRLFPVPRTQWLAAELLSGLLNMLTILGSVCCIAFATGLSAAAPLAAPAFALIGLQAILWLALVQHLVALGKRTLAGNRYGLSAVLLVVVAVGAMVAPVKGLGLRDGIHATVHTLNALVQVLPFSTAYRGVEDLLRGRFGVGILRQLLMLASTGLFAAVVAWLHFRSTGVSGTAGRPAKRERLRSYGDPVTALAQVFRSLVLGSREGRLMLFFPLIASAGTAITDVAIRDIQGRAAQTPWVLGWSRAWSGLPLVGIFLTVLPTLGEIWVNQFGWDGPAVRTLFLLPLSPRQILLGRLVGLSQLHALQAVLGVWPLLLVRRPSAAEVVWGLAAAGTVFLVLTGCGHVVSARFPRSLHGGGIISPTATPLTAFIIPPAVQLPVLSLIVLTYEASAFVGAWGPPLGMSLLLAATGVGYWCALPFLANRLMALREILVEELA